METKNTKQTERTKKIYVQGVLRPTRPHPGGAQANANYTYIGRCYGYFCEVCVGKNCYSYSVICNPKIPMELGIIHRTENSAPRVDSKSLQKTYEAVEIRQDIHMSKDPHRWEKGHNMDTKKIETGTCTQSCNTQGD